MYLRWAKKMADDGLPLPIIICKLISTVIFPGKGLTVCVSVLGGDFPKRAGEAATAKQNLRRCMNEEKVKGFVDVLVSPSIPEGLSNL